MFHVDIVKNYTYGKVIDKEIKALYVLEYEIFHACKCIILYCYYTDYRKKISIQSIHYYD